MSVRPLSADEQQQLKAGLRSSDAFTVRRWQLLRASARGQRPAQMARHLGGATQSVRHASRAFHPQGLACLQAQSRRPKRTRVLLEAQKREQLQALLHESPRTFGTPRSSWTLGFGAEGCCERGLTPYRGSLENIRQALKRLGVNGRRAKRWLTSPDPQSRRKKSAATGCGS